MRRQRVELIAGVTVLGNLAIDVINGAPPSPGGCASFAGVALQAAGGTRPHRGVGRANATTRCSTPARTLRLALRILPADRTSAFRLDYADVDHRRMSVDAIGPVWGAAGDRSRRSRHDVGAPRPAAAHRLPGCHAGAARRPRAPGRLRRSGTRPRRPGGPARRDRHFRPSCSATSACSSSPRTRRSSSPTARSTSRRPTRLGRAGDPGDLRVGGLRHLHRRHRRARARGMAGRGRADHGRRRHVHVVLRGATARRARIRAARSNWRANSSPANSRSGCR